VTRTPADIGAGLAPAREPRPIPAAQRIHVVGAGGAGASAAALLAHHAGAVVSGCDPGGPSPYTAALQAVGVPLSWSHDAGHVTASGTRLVDRLAVTKALTSIQADHPELAAARAADVPLEAWQQVVADVAETIGAALVAVAGTHGKSTSTGWLVHLLVEAGRDPSAFVGALLDARLTGGLAATARWGKGDVLVVEADEYAANFDAYLPDVAVLLNAEWDHPDVFADEAAVLAAFERWVRAAATVRDAPVLVANVGDDGVARIAGRLGDWPGDLLLVALVDEGDDPEVARVALRARFSTAEGPAEAIVGRLISGAPARSGDTASAAETARSGDTAPDDGSPASTAIASGPRLELVGLPGGSVVRVTLGLPGRHNAQNALCVAGAAAALGVDDAAIARGLATFRGVGRRLELKGEPRGVTVLDDYGHHPTAIAATIAAVRGSYPGRRLWAVYEPLTFHRTAAMLDAFADVLATADRAVIADIWAGRDPDTTITSPEALALATARRSGRPATASGSPEATAVYLARAVEPGDVVLVMGGGRSYVIADELVRALGAEASAAPR
jgi:UDP-N-acetylmuramate--alanine ligase